MGVPVPPLVFLVVPLATMFFFSLYFALALLKRSHVQAHKRFVLLATISMVEAGVARWPWGPCRPARSPGFCGRGVDPA